MVAWREGGGLIPCSNLKTALCVGERMQVGIHEILQITSGRRANQERRKKRAIDT